MWLNQSEAALSPIAASFPPVAASHSHIAASFPHAAASLSIFSGWAYQHDISFPTFQVCKCVPTYLLGSFQSLVCLQHL